jgi:hypothetical protein
MGDRLITCIHLSLTSFSPHTQSHFHIHWLFLPFNTQSLVIQSSKRLILTPVDVAVRRPVFILLQMETQSVILHFSGTYIFLNGDMNSAERSPWQNPSPYLDAICLLTINTAAVDDTVNILKTLSSKFYLFLFYPQ